MGILAMHLAIISPYPPALNGIGQYGYYFSRALARSGVFDEISLLTGSSSMPDPGHNTGAMHLDHIWKPGSLNVGQAIVTHINKIKPDLVWFNLGASVFGRTPFANLSGFTSVARIRNMGIPTVLTLHEMVEFADLRALRAPGGPFARIGAQLLSRVVKQADVVCLTIRRYADILSRRWPDRQFIYIPIGAYHTPEVLPHGHEQNLLFFAMMAPFKGLDVLLEAFRSLQQHYPRLRLIVAGAEHSRFPGYAARLQQTYQSLPNVTWMGPVMEENVQNLFKAAQIVVLPYTAFTGSSSVLYQAAMWGRPIVASDLPEIQSLVSESNLNVKYFRNRVPSSLAETISSLLDSATSRNRIINQNIQAIQPNRLEENCRSYLQAFNLALEIRCRPERIPDPIQISLEAA